MCFLNWFAYFATRACFDRFLLFLPSDDVSVLFRGGQITFWSEIGLERRQRCPTTRSPAQQEHGSGPGAYASRPAYPLCRRLRVAALLCGTSGDPAAAAAVPNSTPNHPDAAGTTATSAASNPTTTPATSGAARLVTMTIIYTARFQRLLADRLRRRIAVDERAAAIIVLHQHPLATATGRLRPGSQQARRVGRRRRGGRCRHRTTVGRVATAAAASGLLLRVAAAGSGAAAAAAAG